MVDVRNPDWWDSLGPGEQQPVRNEEWPPGDVAKVLRDHTRIEVEARVVWAKDGEEWVRGHVTRWVRPVVLVELHDPRRRRVWLSAADVRRVTGRPEAGERPEAG
ncbi:MAG TPA: hypothetical protein VK020_12455 [Microlunatus sp.]|nr:hypothetical protein [Microlunatus sp.]